MSTEFLNLYSNVFTNDSVNNCGREMCRKLIKKANELEPEINHGDLKTGFMNIESIKNLKEKIS